MWAKDDKSLTSVEQRVQDTVCCVSSRLGLAVPVPPSRKGGRSVGTERAYYKRVMECLSSFIAAWKYCDDIRHWRINPPAITILCWMMLVILILYPHSLWFFSFFMLHNTSFWNYIGWPRNPRVEYSEQDDEYLDEEEIRARAVRLLDEFPASLERFYSLLFCRGSRAISTLEFSGYCLIAMTFGHLLPRLFLITVVTYLMRPPRFRRKTSPSASVVVASTVGGVDCSLTSTPTTLQVETSSVGGFLQDREEKQDRALIINNY